MDFYVKGNIVDIFSKKIYHGRIFVENGRIVRIEKLSDAQLVPNYIIPGFIDAHVHI